MRAWLFAWLVLGLLPGWAAGDLRLLTEEAPPTSFMRDGQPDGYAVEVVHELIRRTGWSASVGL